MQPFSGSSVGSFGFGVGFGSGLGSGVGSGSYVGSSTKSDVPNSLTVIVISSSLIINLFSPSFNNELSIIKR